MELLGVTLSTLDTKDKDLQLVFHDKKEVWWLKVSFDLFLYLGIKSLFLSFKERDKGPEPEHFHEWDLERELFCIFHFNGLLGWFRHKI